MVRELPGGQKFSQPALWKLEKGKDARTTYVVHIAIACRVSARWLVLGEGPMEEAGLSPEAAAIGRDWERLDDEALQKQVRSFIDFHLSMKKTLPASSITDDLKRPEPGAKL